MKVGIELENSLVSEYNIFILVLSGGSEVTGVSAYDAIEGNAVGFGKKTFKQHLEVSLWLDIGENGNLFYFQINNHQIICKDTAQKNVGTLPPPFIFSEGQFTLDYKDT